MSCASTLHHAPDLDPSEIRYQTEYLKYNIDQAEQSMRELYYHLHKAQEIISYLKFNGVLDHAHTE